MAGHEDAPIAPIQSFFADYPEFPYDPTSSSTGEFYRLCDFFGWYREHPDREDAHEDFRTALVQEFNEIYGTDENNLESWRGLADALDVNPLPQDVTEAKKIFRGTFVNLVDLVDHGRTGRNVVKYGSLAELQIYTTSHAKYFPKEHAYAGGMLKFLLREILTKYEGGKRRNPGRRRR